MLFVNHGCNGTMNLGWNSMYSEQTIDVKTVQANPDKYWFDEYEVSYDPMTERQIGSSASIAASNFKPLQAGDELLENYMAFWSIDDLDEGSKQLQNECNGGAGYVEQYQDSNGEIRGTKYVYNAINMDFVDNQTDDCTTAGDATNCRLQ